MRAANVVVGFFGAIAVAGMICGCAAESEVGGESVVTESAHPASFGAKADAHLRNVAPRDEAELASAEAPITFRWTPLVPKPKEPITYRLKVWQLMQGQNGTQAMRSNQPIVTKDVDNVTQVAVSDVYTGPCRPPYLCDFVWSVTASTPTGAAKTSDPTTFSVDESADFGNVAPQDRMEFTPKEALAPVTFRWTPLVPKPQEPITYRLKVWQLMQGQNGTQAMRSNKPIVTKDVDNVTEAAVSDIYTGPCRPPYLCDFVWNVTATTPSGAVEATKPTTFGVDE